MIYRQEHPRPQFMRADWMNLNGSWEFEKDNGVSGRDRKFWLRDSLDGNINVPFCPESKLSGVGDTDFMPCVWYRRGFSLPESWAGKRVLLHFGAVDYRCEAWVNGKSAGTHKGGYTSFSFDITDLLQDGENILCLCAEDDTRSDTQPTGKQSVAYGSAGCFYTRTTGIWQTVWLEAVADTYLVSTKFYPDPDTCSLEIELAPSRQSAATVTAEAFYEGRPVGSAETTLDSLCPRLHIALSEKQLWEPGCGRLYDLKLTVRENGAVCDEVTSYFGLRSVGLRGLAFCVNSRPVFGRWVLDQGFYPDGIYTAPDDAALRRDIELSMQLGFNGARLHEKVFEGRFLYWADKLGYLVWGEYPNWGYDAQLENADEFLPEWTESVERDFNHPAIIGWCPFNETWDAPFFTDFNDPTAHKQDLRLLKLTYHITKQLDPTRPVIDTSGNFHCTDTDIFDVHDYEQNPELFASYYDKVFEGIVNDQTARAPRWTGRQHYKIGQPLFISEYGGIRWSDDRNGWGYGNAPKTETEFLERYEKLTDILLDNPCVMGFCYTQLYDVEQEQNGLMTYERKFKFDPAIFKKINERKAAIEEQE